MNAKTLEAALSHLSVNDENEQPLGHTGYAKPKVSEPPSKQKQ